MASKKQQLDASCLRLGTQLFKVGLEASQNTKRSPLLAVQITISTNTLFVGNSLFKPCFSLFRQPLVYSVSKVAGVGLV